MKMIAIVAAGALVGSASTACAQDAAAPGEGTIVLYRPSSVIGAGVACPFRHEGNLIVELGRSKYAEWKVPAGEYVITNKVSSVDVRVAPGEIRYVRCKVMMGMLAGKSELQMADRASFEEHSADYERKDIAYSPVLKPQSAQ